MRLTPTLTALAALALSGCGWLSAHPTAVPVAESIACDVVEALDPSQGILICAGIDAAGSIVESFEPVTTNSASAHAFDPVDFVMHLIPTSFFGAFVEGDPLPVLVLAILFGCAIAQLGEKAEPIAALMYFAYLELPVAEQVVDVADLLKGVENGLPAKA